MIDEYNNSKKKKIVQFSRGLWVIFILVCVAVLTRGCQLLLYSDSPGGPHYKLRVHSSLDFSFPELFMTGEDGGNPTLNPMNLLEVGDVRLLY